MRQRHFYVHTELPHKEDYVTSCCLGLRGNVGILGCEVS